MPLLQSCRNPVIRSMLQSPRVSFIYILYISVRAASSVLFQGQELRHLENHILSRHHQPKHLPALDMETSGENMVLPISRAIVRTYSVFLVPDADLLCTDST